MQLNQLVDFHPLCGSRCFLQMKVVKFRSFGSLAGAGAYAEALVGVYAVAIHLSAPAGTHLHGGGPADGGC